jgi:hypothetical protein
MDFLVRRDDLRRCRFAETEPPEPGPGEAVLALERFGLTSNNVTYAVMGDAMSYWKFFPAEEGWGRIPVWGFAHVAASAHADLPEGARVYGYFPVSTHLVVRPRPADGGGFVDATPHRVDLPAVYNAYVPAAAEPAAGEDSQLLFRPLFGTSFLIDDMLDEQGFHDASSVWLSSASSKTALGTAFMLSRRDRIKVVGLTSAGRADFVRGLGVYDRVVSYDELEGAATERAVYVDVSGDAELRGRVHRHLGHALAYDCAVGASHWDRVFADPGPLPGPAPELFFAPARFAKRVEDWGAGGLQERTGAAWAPFAEWAAGWLQVEHGAGPADIERRYLELVEGSAPPEAGYVLAPD